MAEFGVLYVVGDPSFSIYSDFAFEKFENFVIRKHMERRLQKMSSTL